ncbi:MAG TPA: 4-(cytidine 5'-diphospho)-2-C-methyl-D-erythritol kinase [Pseudolabrys sp.]|nr:4-(cytidine 5'-diphospho)-2-C-methyl-D-erythritol kinase [Pseudolabrys sp.]
MSTSPVERAPAKINLTLRVLGRRADGYHDLESLVAFAGLVDRLTLQPGGEPALVVAGPFAGSCGPAAENLVLKAYSALRERVAGLKAGRFALEKNIPVAAGLGGGSADAAAALRLLARLNDLAPGDPRLAAAARATGADVPVCLNPRARIMRGIGDELSGPLDLPPLAALLVNPGVALPTREVFAKFAAGQASQKPIGDVPDKSDAAIGFLGPYENDLTQAAIACAPVIADVIERLRAAPGARLVRMSGSGATCFALFASAAEAAASVRQLHSEHKDWWVCPTTLGLVEKRP